MRIGTHAGSHHFRINFGSTCFRMFQFFQNQAGRTFSQHKPISAGAEWATGFFVIEGKVSRSNKARVIRDGIVVFTGEINALKRFKDDVKEVTTNFECGLSLVNYNDLREGDIIETFQEIEIKAKL